jgi:hypothetical protein
MMSRWSSASIRVRLTGWYATALALMLVLYASATFVAVRHEFFEQFDVELRDDFVAVGRLLTRSPDGQIGSSDNNPDPGGEHQRAYDVWSINGERLYRAGASVELPPVVAEPGTCRIQ